VRSLVASFLAILGTADARQSPDAHRESGVATHAASSAVAGPVQGSSRSLNVLDHGVVGDGVTDDAPAIRRIFQNASGRSILFPGNHIYLIGSNVEPRVQGIGRYPAMDDAGFIISNQSGFRVTATGAVFRVSGKIPLTVTVLIERGRNWAWQGGTFVGDRTGLQPGQENAAIGLINNNRFRVSGVRAKGFGGNGAAFVGDWNVAGQLSDLHLDGVGICFDFAFSKQLTVRNVVALGAGATGATSGPGQVGNKCYSEINDGFYKTYNRTGVAYSETDTVTLENVDASNFNTGVAISSGKHFRFTNLSLHDNPGTASRNIPGLGYYFYCTRGGAFGSSGSPVSDVTIAGGKVARNGTAHKGAGLLIESCPSSGGKSVADLTASGVTFDDNADTAIQVKGSAISGLHIEGNSYRGARQKIAVSDAAKALAR